MQDYVVDLFHSYEEVAVLISILLNIIISIFGVIPSFFLTAANIIVFGFWEGMFLAFIGETLGAIIAFWVYRKGFKNIVQQKNSNKLLTKLLLVKGRDAFFLVIFLRFLPFVPSGLVTFTAAVGAVSGWIFVIASSIGKMPALFIEGYSVYHVTNWTTEGKWILSIIAVVGLVLLVVKYRRR
ncbi:TVP38/TMEM64 family protein [Litchfieldia alkalitelluris]|uniref:TVP38/TMEM64 family protein n=1 Tax=Litchfieldia alkalitelluris TaxID=304268 RepID=UPI0009976FC1|nr:VTT domain-containing protein [Litchfieldia alkalitelluris]